MGQPDGSGKFQQKQLDEAYLFLDGKLTLLQ